MVKAELRQRYGLAEELPAELAAQLAASVKAPKRKLGGFADRCAVGLEAVAGWLQAEGEWQRRELVAGPACYCAALPRLPARIIPIPPLICLLTDAPKGLGTKLPAKKEKKAAAKEGGAGGASPAATGEGGAAGSGKAAREKGPLVEVKAKPWEVRSLGVMGCQG